MAKYDRLAKMFEQMDAEEVSEVLQLFEECLDVYQKSYNKGVRQIAAITVVMSGFVAFAAACVAGVIDIKKEAKKLKAKKIVAKEN